MSGFVEEAKNVKGRKVTSKTLKSKYRLDAKSSSFKSWVKGKSLSLMNEFESLERVEFTDKAIKLLEV